MRTAIIAIHGIGPAQRYALQNEVAENLADLLPGTWEREPFFPPDSDQGNALECRTALRVRPEGDRSESSFDIYEAYWSPASKERTSILTVLRWLLSGIFAPLNSSTPLPASGKKLIFDLTFTIVAIGLVAALPLAALSVLSLSYVDDAASVLVHHDVSPASAAWGLFSHPGMLRSGLNPWVQLSLVSAIIGWFTLGHVAASYLTARRRKRHDGARFPWQQRMRLIALAGGAGCLALSWWSIDQAEHHRQIHYVLVLILTAVSLALLGYRLAHDFFVNRIGDIQIYSTSDSNTPYARYRERIITIALRSLRRVLDLRHDGKPLYDRVYIFGHSLGSTIAMDALIRLQQSVESGDVAEADWRRIAAFVTFGTALEKTRFFFGVGDTALAASYDQWRDDVHGSIFTGDPAVLRTPRDASTPHTIFWGNYWYLRDVVANEVTTYRSSDRDPLARPTCYNVRLQERGTPTTRPWVHSDYLGDPNFWRGLDASGRACMGALDILTLH